MTYSRGNVFVKPHHREHAIPDFVDPKIPVSSSPYHKPHFFNSSPYHKPHFGFLDVYSPFIDKMTNGGRVPTIEKRKVTKEKPMGNVGKL